MADTPVVKADTHQGDLALVTAAAGAATSNHASVIVTSEALTTAAGATYVLTLTNQLITASSFVQAQAIWGNTTQGNPLVTKIIPAAGSVAITVTNVHATLAFNGSASLTILVQLVA